MGIQLRNLARMATVLTCVATLIILVLSALTYCDKEDGIITQRPVTIQDDVEDEVESISRTLSPEYYESSKKPAWLMFQAAKLHSNTFTRDQALRNALNVAFNEREFGLSLIIVAEISYDFTRDAELERIANAALNSEDSKAYALKAAEMIKHDFSRSQILEKVSQSYDPSN